MPRTIVYAAPATATAKGLGPGEAATANNGDGYTERLSKYIPAEVLAGFLPLVGLAADRNSLLLATFVIGLGAALLYLYVHARQITDPARRPRSFFYIFAAIAFIAWAFGTSEPMRTLFGVDAVLARYVLAIVAFALPVADLTIDLTFPRK
jgi:hypothetical protein